MLLQMKSLLSFLVTLFVLVMSCSAADNVSFFRRNASLLNGGLSILTTASLTYKLGLTDFKFVGREHTLGIGGTIGYALTGSWGACTRLSLHKYLYSRWNVYYGIEECTALLPQRLLRLNLCMHHSWAYYSSARATGA